MDQLRAGGSMGDRGAAGARPLTDLDNYDVKILRALVRNGRISWRDLADRIGLSLTPTLRRVRKLETQGFIEGYTATLDERRLAGTLSAFISVRLERQSEDALSVFEERVTRLTEVTSCFQTTGNADYLIRVVVHDLEHYQKLLSELTRIPNVAHITSSFALKSVVRRPGLSM
ncbi:Lrp/AsnC family transcriptional regulator [Sphingomonas sp. KC8]|uniref:Lrp/AsnC family transcriptional regulator n=1 Tax=Sphingomonas sp. KC8 TaxID=1030157 RepID=UPI00031E72F5|nr:Lrp/AsnC family transcriptional regulator [Sphingomonas sp. KC8]